MLGKDGQLDAARYPGFAALAGETTWYRNATTVSNSTWHALPSLLTGRYPTDTGPTAEDDPDSLFTLLDGYQLDVDEAVTGLCPSERCTASRPSRVSSLRALGSDASKVMRRRISLDGTEVDATAEFVEEPEAEGGDDDGVGPGALRRNQPARFTSFLDRLRPADRPTLHYLHLLVPHQPWRYLPSGRSYPHPKPDPGKLEDRWPAEPWPAELGRQRHLLQVQYVDGLVRAFVERLRETGLLDDAVLAVVSDHGVAFQPGQPVRGLVEGGLAPAVHPELMWVPFFLKLPGEGGGAVSDAGVELVDLVPTVADAVDAEVPWPVEGRSVLGPGRPPAAPKTFFQAQLVPAGVRPGERVEVDATTSWPLVLERSVPEELRGTDPLAPYRVGPQPELVGQRVDALGTGRPSPVRATVDRPGRLGLVDLASDSVPALVTGRLLGPSRARVVLALDGEVAAVVPTFGADPSQPAFAALLPEPLLQDGANELDLYLMDGAGAPLQPLDVQPALPGDEVLGLRVVADEGRGRLLGLVLVAGLLGHLEADAGAFE